MTRGMGGPRTITIDSPFIVAFMVNGEVAVAFHVTQEDWKAPPSLGTKEDAKHGDIW